MASESIEDVYVGLQACVGSASRRVLDPVCARDFQRAAAAIGDLNPVYFDTQAAREAGHEDVTAPPGYLSSVLEWGWGPVESALRTDGVVPGTIADAPVGGLRLMGAGQELVFHADVVDGQVLTVESQVHDVTLKQGESGPFIVLRISRRYVDQHGSAVLDCLESFIGR